MNLNQVTVPSNDIAASIVFYQTLGLELIVKSPHYARFECPEGDATFSIHLAKAPLGESTIVYFENQDLDEKVRSLEKKGIAFEMAPKDQPWLWREAWVKDPFGNLIILYNAGDNRKNPPWRIQK